MFVIAAKKRSGGQKRSEMKKSGEIPAVFYGAGQESTPISVRTIDFKKVWHEAGESSAVKVKLSEGGDIDALIHEVQTDPVTDEPIHADFLAIDMNKKIKVKVPLEFTGLSEAVKNGIGNLVKVLHEIEVEALPANLPNKLSVDVSKLATLSDTVMVEDIKLPDGVVAVNSALEVVASIVAQVEEKEEAPEPIDLSTIEVEKKGKKEEEGVEGEVAVAPTPAPEKVEKKEKK